MGTERQVEEYFPENCLAAEHLRVPLVPMGFIPQVSKTFAYFECTYGVMNEMQLGIGESTCSGVFGADPICQGGRALFSVNELSQVALERCTTAREAILLMGGLAEQYGFYGSESGRAHSAESLVVIDPREAWVFHILPDPTGSSAIWVAQRVPSDCAVIVPNMFVIREVDLSNTADFLGRSDMWSIAEAHGLWNPSTQKDFTRTFSFGEYKHKFYSGTPFD